MIVQCICWALVKSTTAFINGGIDNNKIMMLTRIKYIKKNNSWYYVVQIKKWLFWKTIYINTVFTNVEKFIDTLAQIDEFNSKAKSSNKIVYNGWAVRNVFANTGLGYSINFFNSYPSRRKTVERSESIWEDCNGNITPTMEIKMPELFGKECLEPMKVIITIEKMEE